MSTAFSKMEASAMPSLVCAGKISEVSATAPSKGGVYLTTPFKIDAYDAGRGLNAWFTFRAEWFSEKFHKEVAEAGSINKYFEDNYSEESYEKNGETKNVAVSFSFVYANNFCNADGTAFLEALFPEPEAFEKFTAAAFALGIDPVEPDLAELSKFLQEQLTDRKFGYVLVQKQIKTDAIGEDGKPIYIKDKNYDLKKYFTLDEKTVKSWERSTSKPKSKSKMTFSADSVL